MFPVFILKRRKLKRCVSIIVLHAEYMKYAIQVKHVLFHADKTNWSKICLELRRQDYSITHLWRDGGHYKMASSEFTWPQLSQYWTIHQHHWWTSLTDIICWHNFKRNMLQDVFYSYFLSCLSVIMKHSRNSVSVLAQNLPERLYWSNTRMAETIFPN